MPVTTPSRLFRPASWPILVKLTIDLLLIALVPLIIAVWITGRTSRRELEDLARQNVQLLARSTAQRLDQLISDTRGVVAQASLDDDVIAAAAAGTGRTQEEFDAIQRRLLAVTTTNPDHASIFVTNALGVGIASTNSRNIGQDLAFREYCRIALGGREHVSEFLIGKTTREPGVYFSSPVRDPSRPATQPTTEPASTQPGNNGLVVGAAVVKLRGEKVWEIVDGVRIGTAGFAMLVDDAGVVISHPDKEKLFHSFLPVSAERLKEINPELRYSLDKIESLDMPELHAPLNDESGSGNASFTMAPTDSEPGRSNWVAGYAQMKQRPWKVAVVQPLRQFQMATHDMVAAQWRTVVTVAGVASLLAIWRARSFVKPLLSLNTAAEQLSTGDFTARATKYSDDEIGQLATSFNAMVPKLQHAVELQQSLALATEVQQALLPQKPPQLRKLDIAGHSRYCDSTGGDYYDFADVLDWPDRNALIAVGDVTGHGIGAALVMCTARAAVRSAALSGGSLGQILSAVNSVLTQDAEHRLYMTMTLMVIDPDLRRIRYACAAHDPIVIYDPATDVFTTPDDGDIPLGAMPGTQYAEYEARDIKPGSVIVLGTDGIWEARNHDDEMFGKDRLDSVIRANALGSAHDIATAIDATLSGFLGGRPIQDDVTYVVAKMRA
ncbi:MAG TPA: SpoIIE family protein phosphatase [Tepidisphaeraceae bacterium]|nr:SpoIIE family protein phosphatase [Tepidisphaeraceae bacterium]